MAPCFHNIRSMSPVANDHGAYYPNMTAGGGAGAFSSHSGRGHSPSPYASSPPPKDYSEVLCTEFVAPICVCARLSFTTPQLCLTLVKRREGCWRVYLLARTLIAVFNRSHHNFLFIFMQAYGASPTSNGGNLAYGGMPGGLHCKMPSALLILCAAFPFLAHAYLHAGHPPAPVH